MGCDRSVAFDFHHPWVDGRCLGRAHSFWINYPFWGTWSLWLAVMLAWEGIAHVVSDNPRESDNPDP